MAVPFLHPFMLSDLPKGSIDHAWLKQQRILTREITSVGDNNFIGHDINSRWEHLYFIMDRKQPPSVDEKDFGKAIAVHCTCPNELVGKENIGLLLRPKELFGIVCLLVSPAHLGSCNVRQRR